MLNNQDITNNHSEAARNKLRHKLGVKNPSIWKFIDGLRVIQKSRDQMYERSICGMPASKKLKRYIDADEGIKKLVEEFGTLTPSEYLRAIAQNYLILH